MCTCYTVPIVINMLCFVFCIPTKCFGVWFLGSRVVAYIKYVVSLHLYLLIDDNLLFSHRFCVLMLMGILNGQESLD